MTFSKAFVTLTDDVSVVTAAQLLQIDLNQSRAVDGNAGGNYTPSSNIQITGPQSIELMGTVQLEYASRTLYRRKPLIASAWTTGTWAYTATNILTNNAEGYADVPIYDLPHGQVLDSVTVKYQGVGGTKPDPVTGGGLLMPKFNLYRKSTTGGTAVVSTATDTVTAKASYVVAHDIQDTGVGHTIDLVTYEYFIRLYSEQNNGSGDYDAGGIFYALTLGFTVTSQTEV